MDKELFEKCVDKNFSGGNEKVEFHFDNYEAYKDICFAALTGYLTKTKKLTCDKNIFYFSTINKLPEKTISQWTKICKEHNLIGPEDEFAIKGKKSKFKIILPKNRHRNVLTYIAITSFRLTTEYPSLILTTLNLVKEGVNFYVALGIASACHVSNTYHHFFSFGTNWNPNKLAKTKDVYALKQLVNNEVQLPQNLCKNFGTKLVFMDWNIPEELPESYSYKKLLEPEFEKWFKI